MSGIIARCSTREQYLTSPTKQAILNCQAKTYFNRETATLADLEVLQQTLGIFFNDRSLLKQALVHSSYINENPEFTLGSSERLEFLGDAVLGLVVAQKLYQDFTQQQEGKMTKLRAALVRQDSLANIAQIIKLGDYLYLGKGEEASGGRNKPANLAGALEAVIAAIYLDQGLSVTNNFILRLFDKELEKVRVEGEGFDYKSRLQELIQARREQPPTYHVMAETGLEHDKTFTIEVRVGDRVLGRGSGKGKKKAEAEAARSALEQLLDNFTG